MRGESGPSVQRWLAVVVLIGAVVAVYWNSLEAPFLFDDTGAVLHNPTIRQLGSWAVLNPPSDGSTTTGRPVVNLSFAVNHAISGENVGSYHVFNLAIHALAALTLMGVVKRTLSGVVLRDRYGAAAPSLAFLVALLWALHPLQTESVVCIAQRTESFCGFFYLLTLYGFVRGTEAVTVPSRCSWFAFSVMSCLAGMGTKEVMVTVPVIVWLYDRTFVAGSFFAALRLRRLFYTTLAGTWLLLAWLVLKGGGGRGVAAGFGLGISWWNYLLQQSEAVLLYLKLSFWPNPLVLDYGTTVVQSVADVWWQGICVVALLAGTVWALVRKPVLGFAGAWFFVILAPSSSVVPLVTQTMAEHRMYLPLAGVIGLVVLAAYRWGSRRASALLAAVVVVFGFLTVARNHDYRDGVVIWSDTVAKYPSNARAHNNLAWALQQQGKAEEANRHFARAVELQPGYVSARYNWGVALLDQGRAVDAIVEFEAAVRLAPGHADACVNLGNALMQVQRAAEAVPQYEAVLRLRPGADVHYDLGVALIELGRPAEAVMHLRAALQLNPDLPDAYYQLARVAEQGGQLAEAERQYQKTLELAPDHLAAHRNLGLLFARRDRLTPAAEHFRAVIRLAPADADAHANLGNVYLLQGQAREAVKCYEEALRLRPDDASLRENLQQARESVR
jgi:tetratricopeptide (TPR) repeat protein